MEREQRLIEDLRKKNALLKAIFQAATNGENIEINGGFLVAQTMELEINMSSFLNAKSWFDYSESEVIADYAKGNMSEGYAAEVLAIDRLDLREKAQTTHPEEYFSGDELARYLAYRDAAWGNGCAALSPIDWSLHFGKSNI